MTTKKPTARASKTPTKDQRKYADNATVAFVAFDVDDNGQAMVGELTNTHHANSFEFAGGMPDTSDDNDAVITVDERRRAIDMTKKK